MALTESNNNLKVGDTAPDFSLQGIDGNMYALKDFTNKQGLLVIFMCNHCPYVIAKTEAMNTLQEKFGDTISIIGINSNDPTYPGENTEDTKRFAAEKGITFPYLIDGTQVAAKIYGAVCTPDPFLFNSEGKLAFHGRLTNAMQPEDTATENTMEDVISQMLAGESIAPEPKLSMGCSIKWIEQSS